MICSFFSYLSVAIYFSAVLLLLLPFLNRKIVGYAGCKVILLFFILISIRVLAPIEFYFAKEIYFTKVIPVFSYIFYTDINIVGQNIYSGHILFIGIFLIAGIILLAKAIKYKRMKQLIHLTPPAENKRILQQWSTLCQQYPKLNIIKVVEIDSKISPFYMGFAVPVIVLPKCDFTDEEYYYILTHEAFHYLHKDQILKILVDLICTLHWWNPLFYWLRREINTVIEMQNDNRIVAKCSEELRCRYIQCLASTVFKINSYNVPFALTFSKSNATDLKNRIHLINREATGKLARRFVSGLCILTVIVSFTFVFEPINEPPGTGYFTLTPENSYIIQKDNDTYDIYYEGTFLETVNDLAYYNPSIKVYKENKDEK